MTERERLLLDAAAAVRERGESYGDPQAHFARTVGAINAVLAHKLREPLTAADWGICMILDKCAREQHQPREPLTAADWGICMILDKCAREQHQPKRDNMTDAAGYAACVAEIRQQQHDAAWSRDRRETDAETP